MVTVDSFVIYNNKHYNNPNIGAGILILQAIDYKIKYPKKNVNIDYTSFHFLVDAAICINRINILVI